MLEISVQLQNIYTTILDGNENVNLNPILLWNSFTIENLGVLSWEWQWIQLKSFITVSTSEVKFSSIRKKSLVESSIRLEVIKRKYFLFFSGVFYSENFLLGAKLRFYKKISQGPLGWLKGFSFSAISTNLEYVGLGRKFVAQVNVYMIICA